MNIAICDDCLSDAERIGEICSEYGTNRFDSVEIHTSSSKLIHDIENENKFYDLIFLDIDMPYYNGITVGKKIKECSPEAVIVFITSYPQYAIDAYECEAFHYILKPAQKEKVFSVLDRIIEKYNADRQYIVVKYRNQPCKLKLSDIYYIECFKKHIIYHLKDRSIETVDKLSSVYSKLQTSGFYQIHQGYIVNFDKVYEFKDHSVVLDDGRNVMISVRKKKEVLLAYAKYAERYL